jgi:ketosteroid isomerase-like protein
MTHEEEQQVQVLKVVQEFNRAYAANDVEAYFSFVANDITVLTPSNPYRVEGLAADREEFEFSLRAGTTRLGYFQEMQPHVQVYGDTAIVTYFSRGSYGVGERAKTHYLKETDVLTRRKEGWKVVHIHLSASFG